MSRAARARRIATATAAGGGGLGLLGGTAMGLLLAQARQVRRGVVGVPIGHPPAVDGQWGTGEGEPLSLVLLGDSTAAGLGVERTEQTLGVLLAVGLAELAGRPIRLTSVAVIGAESAHLGDQVGRALGAEPDAAIIMIGGNDVTHRIRTSVSAGHLEQAVRRLRTAGVQVVVGTCPDLGTIEPIPRPLRWAARRLSRRLAAVQTIATVEAGGRTVSIGSILGPEFAADPRVMFAEDRFHPSAAGYAAAAAAILPSVASALGVAAEEEPQRSRREGVLPVALAAAEAVEESGTEVAAAQVAGHDRGPRGRWALLRHRRPASTEPLTATPAAAPAVTPEPSG